MQASNHPKHKSIVFLDKLADPHKLVDALKKAGMEERLDCKYILSDGTKPIDPNPWGDKSSEVTCLSTMWGSLADIMNILKHNPNIKWIHSFTAGVDKLISPEITNHSCAMTNAKGVFSPSLAEFAIFQMLWFEKHGALWQQQQQVVCTTSKWELLVTAISEASALSRRKEVLECAS